MDQIQIGDLRIAHRRAGTGPPLVLLHGGASDSRVFLRQLEDLSDEFTVVAWDAPGCGRSPDPPETFRMADYADCLAGFIGALGLGRAHVLGHSFGGGLALEFYGRHPTIPRTLILAGAYAGWAGSLPPGEVEQRLQTALEMTERGSSQLGPGWPAGVPAASATSGLAAESEAIAFGLHPVGTRVMATAFAEADLRHVLPLVDVPTLLLYGEADERAPLKVAEDIHRGIRGSELVMLPGVGHESYLEAPQRFNAEVRRFLRSAQG
ncbi:MAG: hydrolase [Actinobacteria bacterium RBG_16_70_17]|nr:MAG: hydrolase [Actinobacteria bacterium RBG_16_70_17]